MEPSEITQILSDAGVLPSDRRTGYALVAIGLAMLARSGEGPSRLQAEVMRMLRDLRAATLAAEGQRVRR